MNKEPKLVRTENDLGDLVKGDAVMIDNVTDTEIGGLVFVYAGNNGVGNLEFIRKSSIKDPVITVLRVNMSSFSYTVEGLRLKDEYRGFHFIYKNSDDQIDRKDYQEKNKLLNTVGM